MNIYITIMYILVEIILIYELFFIYSIDKKQSALQNELEKIKYINKQIENYLLNNTNNQ